MKTESRSTTAPGWAESAACLYLLLPVFLFFWLFIAVPIAVVACSFLAWAAWEIARRTTPPRFLTFDSTTVAIAVLAALWAFLGGSFGVAGLNTDWPKHFAVFNFLAAANHGLYTGADEILRYSLGWYLVPSALAKMLGHQWQAAAAGAWSAIGVFIFFRLLIDQVGAGSRAVLGVMVFILFSGADIIGSAISGFQLGPKYHIEWWAGWIAYDSNTTLLFWVPQHALPAWLMVAVMLRQVERPTLLPYLALLFAATQLWSPLVALGLAPFGAYLLLRPNGGAMLKDWRTWASVVIVGLPTGLYLAGASQTIPAYFSWDRPCKVILPCFTWPAYPLFLAVEVLAFFAVLAAWKPARTPMFLIAALVLVLIPAYTIGVYNDFGMRASIPALAVVAIYSATLIAEAPKKYIVAMVAILALGAATPFAEIARGLMVESTFDPDGTFEAVLNQEPTVRGQYFAPPRPWLMRRP